MLDRFLSDVADFATKKDLKTNFWKNEALGDFQRELFAVKVLSGINVAD